MSCQSSHTKMLALLSGRVTSHRTFLFPVNWQHLYSSQNPAPLPLLSLGAIFVFCVTFPGPEEASQEIHTWWHWDCFSGMHTALTQGLSELHQGSPWHSWFLAICSACHTCQPLLHIFVCLCFGPGCPLHFLNATSEAKLEQNFSNAVEKSHLLPPCTL